MVGVEWWVKGKQIKPQRGGKSKKNSIRNTSRWTVGYHSMFDFALVDVNLEFKKSKILLFFFFKKTSKPKNLKRRLRFSSPSETRTNFVIIRYIDRGLKEFKRRESRNIPVVKKKWYQVERWEWYYGRQSDIEHRIELRGPRQQRLPRRSFDGGGLGAFVKVIAG